MTVQAAPRRSSGGYLDRPSPSGLADVIEIILDKGMVIDVFIRVSLIGIEVLTIDARIVIASVDTYLRFAEATNRLDLESKGKDIEDLIGGTMQSGAQGKTKGAIQGAKEAITGGDDDDDDDDGEEKERPRRSSSSRSSSERPRKQAARSSR